jgi:iron complex outermembrane receptor protein
MTDQLRNSSNMAPREYGMATYAKTNMLGGRVEAEWTSLTLGLEGTRRVWNAQTKMAGMMYMPQYSIPDVTATTVGLYGLYDRPLSTNLTLKAGARIDRFRSVADAWLANASLYYAFHDTRNTANDFYGASGNLSLLWTPIPALEVAAGVGSALRGPDPQEFYIALKRMGADWVGNPELDPARNTGLNLDVAYQRGGYSLRATIYRDSVHNFITVYDQKRLHMVPGVMSPVAKTYANVDAVLYGGELSATAVLGQRFFLSADAAAVRGTKDPRRDLGMTSENLSEIPPFTGRVAGRYDDGRYFAELEGVFSAAQDQVDGDLGETPTPGWGICNLRLGAKWKWLSLTVAANNLFDRYYMEYLSYQRDPYRSGMRIPEPGRNLTFTVGWRF